MHKINHDSLRSILFVCHGNICRSVMAQYMMEDLVRQKHLEGSFFIDSAGVSAEESGNSIYPAARRKLQEKGVPTGSHRARKITSQDFYHFDEIYALDQSNLNRLQRIRPKDAKCRLSLLADEEIDDPWYTGDFEETWQKIHKALPHILMRSSQTENLRKV